MMSKLLMSSLSLLAIPDSALGAGACSGAEDLKAYDVVKNNLSAIQETCITEGAPGAQWYDHCLKKFMSSQAEGEKCMGNCVHLRANLSPGCSTCFGAISGCVYKNCVMQCIDAKSPGCIACGKKFCDDDFLKCSGLPSLPPANVAVKEESAVTLGAMIATSGLSGKYCGTAMGYHMSLYFNNASYFDVNITIEGHTYHCMKEPYAFDVTTGAITTHVRDQNNCLHDGVKKHYDDPDTVFFTYDAKNNRITFRVDTVDTELSPAMCDLMTVSSGPSGKYCGTAGGYHLSMNFIDASLFDLNMTADGQPYVCKQEPYTFDVSTGSIGTNVRDESDCLHVGVKKRYDDPDTVFFAYDAKDNRITFRVDTVDMELFPAQCGLTMLASVSSGQVMSHSIII